MDKQNSLYQIYNKIKRSVKGVNFIFQKLLKKMKKPFKKKTYPISVNDIKEVLEKLGIQKGDVILVHSAAKNLFNSSLHPPEKPIRNLLVYSFDIIDMLIELIGDSGTLLMPTDKAGRPLVRSSAKDLFDYSKSPSVRGIITEIFRRRPDVSRSVHPFYNVTGWGRDAKKIIEENEKSQPFVMDQYSPWFKMTEMNGKYIILGKDFDITSAVHVIEDYLGDNYPKCIFQEKLFPLKYIDLNQKIKTMNLRFHLQHWTDQSVIDFHNYLNSKYNFAKIQTIGNTKIIVFNAKDHFDAMQKELSANIGLVDFLKIK